MKKLLAIALFSIFSLAFWGCSDDSTSPDSTPHVLTGTWDVIATFSDTTGVEEPIESLPSVNKFEVSGNKLKWTTLVGETYEGTSEWEFTSNGNSFEFYNKINPDNRYYGVMLDDDNFELLWGKFAVEVIQISFPKYNKAVTVGERQK